MSETVDSARQYAGVSPSHARASSPPRGPLADGPTRLVRLAGSEAAAAAGLLGATVVALVWANLPGATYQTLWRTPIALSVGASFLELDARHWVNDALMTLFFFLIALEVKRDVVFGELRERRRARLPVVGAIAGLALPAALFLLVTALSGQGEQARGAWGAVISTDTAFVLGLLAVLGNRVPVNLRTFVLALAVVDDIGALVVIAAAYTDALRVVPLLVALAALGLIVVMRRRHVWRGAWYLAAAVPLWLEVLASGIHPTIAGVVIGLALPVTAPHPLKVGAAEGAAREYGRSPTAGRAHRAVLSLTRAVSVNDRGQRALHPWVNMAIVPLFAVANAGVVIDAATLRDAAGSGLTWAVVAGLVLGKVVAVGGACLLAARLGLGRLPSGLFARHVLVAGLLSGVGFTISLFIIDLALQDPALASNARLGVLAGSAISAVLALVTASLVHRIDLARLPGRQRLRRPVTAEHDHVRGRVGAPMELVVYASMVVTGAGRTAEVVAEALEALGDDAVFAFRHLPDAGAHEPGVADLAAHASEAAAEQGRFWPMHDALVARISDRLDERAVRRCSVEAGMNLARLDEALTSKRHQARVSRDVLDAKMMGLADPPCFFVNGQLYDGPLDAESLIAALGRSARPQQAVEQDQPLMGAQQ